MTKTPEEMAEEYADESPWHLIRDSWTIARDGFLAGYQAAKDTYKDALSTYEEVAKQMLEEAVRIMSPKDQLADAGTVMNSSNNSNGWISVKERLPTDADGVTQLWMRGRSLAELVLGCHAVMFEHNEKIEGVLDINKPDGLWDLSDFTHWMPLPKPPEDK